MRETIDAPYNVTFQYLLSSLTKPTINFCETVSPHTDSHILHEKAVENKYKNAAD
jgi:hypothetical protein